ncbi:MAG: PspC domain-containing protein [Candidatus Zixiibacteriota bacterium]|nr:MAG: PspC domain-containing protein [candidate division Zixibacteria bacterium]
MNKRLYRSEENKIVGGVCGGIGEYFEIDPVLVRIITVLLIMAPGVGVLAYIIGWIIIPKRPPEVAAAQAEYQFSSWNKYISGLILVAIGAILLVRENWFWFDWDEFWPIVLILGGLALIFRRKKPKDEAEIKVNGQVHTDNNMNHNEGSSV